MTSYIYIFTSTTIYGVEVIPNSKYDQKCEYLFLARDEYYNVQCIVGKIKEQDQMTGLRRKRLRERKKPVLQEHNKVSGPLALLL